jgi:hypothetical protein
LEYLHLQGIIHGDIRAVCREQFLTKTTYADYSRSFRLTF